MANPPMQQRKKDKRLDAASVGNYFGLVKEYLKGRFPDHTDFEDEWWFTNSKSQLVRHLAQNKIRTGDEEASKVSVVRERSIYKRDEDMPDFLSIQRDLLRSDISDKYERRALLNTTFTSDGRSGEGKYLSYRSFAYEPVANCVLADW